MPLGSYNLFAKADANNEVSEGPNEGNNFSAAKAVELVDICTFSDFNDNGAVDILDLVSVVNDLGRRMVHTNRHLNVKKSQAPFPEVINVIDLYAATGCWGSPREILPEGGDLLDIQIQRNGDGFDLLAQFSGNVASIESLVFLPASVRLEFGRETYDLLLSGYTKRQTVDSGPYDYNGAYTLNAFAEVGYNHRTLSNQVHPVQYFTTLQDIDLLDLQPLAPGEPFTTGVAVQVVFADLTTAMMVKKFDFVHAPDRNLHAALTSELNLPAGSPMPGHLARNVTTLDLSNAGIVDLSGIHAFENVETLILDNNALTMLPDLSALTHLHTLSIANNDLHRLFTLPASLRHLNLSGNNLAKMPDLGSLTQLQNLDVSHNKLARLHSSISGLTQLRQLRCSHNGLTEIPALPAATEVLYADHNMLRRLPNFAPNTLEILHANHNYLTLISNLAPALHLQMQEVVINDNMLDVRSCQVLMSLKEMLKKSGGVYQAQNQAYDLAICNLTSIAL